MSLEEAKEAHINAIVMLELAKATSAEASETRIRALKAVSDAESRAHMTLCNLLKSLETIRPADIAPSTRIRTAHEARKS